MEAPMNFSLGILLNAVAISGIAQSADTVDPDSIHFRPIYYDKLFETATAAGKNVFMYFHFDGCGACDKMEQTAFQSNEVINYFNDNFISFEVNTLKGQGVGITKEHGVKLQPTFLFLDQSGTQLHKAVGVFSSQEFLNHARTANSQDESLSAMKLAYQNGKSDPDFLFRHCYLLRDSYELDSSVVRQYIATQSDEQLLEEKNIRFIYEFIVHRFVVSFGFDSREYAVMRGNRELFDKFYDPEQVTTRIIWVMNNEIGQLLTSKNEERFRMLTEILSQYDDGKEHLFKELDGRVTGMITTKHLVLTAEMLFFEAIGDEKRFNASRTKYIQAIWDDSDELNTLAWNIFETSDSFEDLRNAKSWVIRSIELDENYANADTYANILFKLGEYQLALEQAGRAIELAEMSDVDPVETVKLQAEILEKMKK